MIPNDLWWVLMRNSSNLLVIRGKKIPMKPGQAEKYDYEYKRNGKVNIFVVIDFKAGKRDIKVTDRRTKKDFALYMKHLVNEVFPEAEVNTSGAR